MTLTTYIFFEICRRLLESKRLKAEVKSRQQDEENPLGTPAIHMLRVQYPAIRRPTATDS